MRTLDDLGDLRGRRVFVRADLNVPLASDTPSAVPRITDDTRIRAALPTLIALRERGARIVLASHLGRPRTPDPSLSLAPVARRIGELLPGARVVLAPAVVGERVTALARELGDGEILLLENVRFEAGETRDDPVLARAFADLADAYVGDAFGASHRAHASTVGVAELLPAAAGLLLAREVQTLRQILEAPERPLVAVVGGSKVTDKIAVLLRFLDIADAVCVGGAMCFPFLKAQGHSVGASLCEPAGLEPARRALARACSGGARLMLPVDLVLTDRFGAGAQRRELDGVDVPEGWIGADIGGRTARADAAVIAAAGTVFWNGPMGAFEFDAFAAGTRAIAQAVAHAPGTTVVGGGDSVAALNAFGLQDLVTHVSTGGGATLELVEGRELPGVAVLERPRPGDLGAPPPRMAAANTPAAVGAAETTDRTGGGAA